jgi:hypothetical protein
MADVTLRDVLARSPDGLGASLAAWIVIRIADAMTSARAPTPDEVRVSKQGAISVDPPRGDPPLRAPEGGTSPRAAVYALGLLFVETASGRPPTSRELASDSIPALSDRVRDANEALDRIAGRALHRTPAARYAAPSELAAALDRYLVDELHDVGPSVLAQAVERAMGAQAFKSFPPPPPEPRVAPAAPKKPKTEADRIAAAELDLKFEPRSSHPAKPRLDPGLVRLSDVGRNAGAGITDAALIGAPKPARAAIDVDSGAHRRPGTLMDDTPEPEPERNWILYIVAALAALLVIVLVYQYVVRPYLLNPAG